MKRVAAFLISLIIASCFFVTATAANCTITISKVDAKPGDTAYIDLSINDNPGIAAITISITYDSSVLEYKGYKEGFLSDYTIKAHPSKNTIRFINLEKSDVTQNGTFLTLIFKVSDSAVAGNSKVDINYKKGDFCNWNAQAVSPTIVAGGVNITGESKFENNVSDETKFESNTTDKNEFDNKEESEAKPNNSTSDPSKKDEFNISENANPDEQIVPSDTEDLSGSKKPSYFTILTTVFLLIAVAVSVLFITRNKLKRSEK